MPYSRKRMFLALLFICIACLGGCTTLKGEELSSSAPSEKQEQQEQGEILLGDPAWLIWQTPDEQIEDAGLLQSLWEDYLFDGLLAGILPEDRTYLAAENFDPLSAARFLRLRICRDGRQDEMIGLEPQENGGLNCGIPIALLEEYAKRYFWKTPDFTGCLSAGDGIFYDAQGKMLLISCGEETPPAIPGLAEGWQGERLVEVGRYLYEGQNYLIAHAEVESDRGMFGEKFSHDYLFWERGEEDYLLMASQWVAPETDRISVSGEYTDVAALGNGLDFSSLTMVAAGDQMDSVVLVEQKEKEICYYLVDLLTGEVKNSDSISVTEGVLPDFSGIRGGYFVTLIQGRIRVYDRSLNLTKPATPLPNEILNLTGKDGNRVRLSGVDFTQDLTKMAFCDADGAKIYDFVTEELTTIPGTAPILISADPPSWERYQGAQFEVHDTKLWLWKSSGEEVTGYDLYDLDTQAHVFYPYRSTAGVYDRIETARGAYLIDHLSQEEDGLQTVFVDFITGAVEMDVALPEGYPVGLNGEVERYTGLVDEQPQGNGMSDYHFTKVDAHKMELTDIEAVITAPDGSVRLLGALSDGRLLVTAQYLEESITVLL